MPTAAEAVAAAHAALSALPPEEHAEAKRLLANEAGGLIAAVQSQRFADGKKEGAKTPATLSTDLTEARNRVAELEAEVASLTAKQPDYAAKEQALKDAHKRALDAEKKRADDALAALKAKDVDLSFADFLTELTKPAEDGTRVDPEWAADVARARWGNRLAPKDDGGVRVLKLGEEMEYDAPDAKTAVKLLAADARKTVPARYVLTNTDTGGGIANGGAYGRSGGVATVDAIVAQKSTEYSL